MCGIFAVLGDRKNRAAQTVLQGLKKLEYRGYDSWGIAITGLSQLIVEKHVGKIGGAETKLEASSFGLGHTRWATHGGVDNNNAHPQLDCRKKIALVHNGIVENYQELKVSLLQKGHRFISETDTEVVAHLIEERQKGKNFLEAVFTSFRQLKGANAIAVLDFETKSIVACRYGSPMVIGLGNKEYFLASDPTAFLDKTRKVVFVDDQEGVKLSLSGVEVFDLKTGAKKKYKAKTLDLKLEDVTKDGYPHYLLKEILQQPKTIFKAGRLNQPELKLVADKLKNGYKLLIFACGSAYYCGLVAQYFLAQTGVEAQVFGAYEADAFLNFCNKKTVALAISQSGETADTLIIAKKAKQKGAFLTSLVNVQASSLARLSDCVLQAGAGPEIAVVSTKAFTAQLTVLFLLAAAVVGRNNQAQAKVEALGKKLQSWLTKDLQKQVLDLAKQLVTKNHLFIIGKHLNYPAGLEIALKIKETSYLHAEGFAAGELKHGVLSLIDKGVPCLVLADSGKYKKDILSSAAEVKARGGLTIGITPFAAPEFDLLIKTPDLKELNLFFNIIVGQLLGYYLSIGRGADPDKPRNLAKSVTVK